MYTRIWHEKLAKLTSPIGESLYEKSVMLSNSLHQAHNYVIRRYFLHLQLLVSLFKEAINFVNSVCRVTKEKRETFVVTSEFNFVPKNSNWQFVNVS